MKRQHIIPSCYEWEDKDHLKCLNRMINDFTTSINLTQWDVRWQHVDKYQGNFTAFLARDAILQMFYTDTYS